MAYRLPRKLLVIFALPIAIAGCGGGGGSGTSVSPSDSLPPSPPVQNTAPEISGAPLLDIEEDIAYTFVPSASDADGDILTFNIQNRPAWASFDNTTGTLTGTPTWDDVGVYGNIEISASDGTSTASLPAFDIEVIEVASVTLVGVVTDAPVPNAIVTVEAGSHRYETTADQAGAYSADFRVRTSQLDNNVLLTITGRGVGSQAGVELRSVVGRLGDILDQAGPDEVLTADENHRLNVTHVSTARYLHAVDNNGGAVPTNASDLALAEQAIDLDKLLDSAGLIKLIIDEDFIVIPTGQTTLTMLQSSSAGITNQSTILSLLAENGYLGAGGDPVASLRDALDAVIEASLADPAVTGAFDGSTLTGTTVWAPPAFRRKLPMEGDVLDFANDGRGVAYEDVLRQLSYGLRNQPAPDVSEIGKPFSWSIVEGTMTLNFDDYTSEDFPFGPPFDFLVLDYGFDQVVADFMTVAFNEGRYVDSQVPVTTQFVSRAVKILGTAGDKVQVHIEENRLHSIDDALLSAGWSGPLPRGQSVDQWTSLVYREGLVPRSIAAAPAAGDLWAVPTLYAPNETPLAAPAAQGLFIDLFALNAGGTTAPGALSQQIYQWSSSAEGLTLQSGTGSWTFTPIETDGDLYFGLATYRLGGNIVFRSAQWLSQANSDFVSLANDLVQAPPLFWSTGLAKSSASHYLADGRLDPSLVFGYQFLDGTQMARVYDPMVDENPLLSREEPFWLWSVSGPEIVLERIRTGYLRHRRWLVLNYTQGGRAVLLERDFTQQDPDPWEVLIGPRLNTIEIEDLGTWPEAAGDALTPPGGGNTGGSNPYTGPVARNADVLAFQQELWSNVRTPDRCGGCHNEAVGQAPMFARSDDVNLAYDVAITVVESVQPASSLLVEKVASGHNCWLADPAACGTIMTTWIENWLGGGQ